MESEILRLQGQFVSTPNARGLDIMADALRWTDWKEKGQSGGSRIEKC